MPPPSDEPRRAGRQRDESWHQSLAKEDWPLFNSLRDWRAKADGIPPYVVCNNRQLAAVVKARPESLTEVVA